METQKIVLLDSEPSSFGMRVRIALAVKGIEYEYLEEDLFDKSPVVAEMNPVHKMIPILIHNGIPICESLIILQYIDQVWNHNSPLLPSDPYQRAQARFWADFIDKKIYTSGKAIFMEKGELQEKAKKEFIESLKTIEGELGDKKFFGGESLGYVDVALAPYNCWFYTYETIANFSIESECPKLIAWGKRCMQMDSVSKSLADPHKILEFIFKLQANGFSYT